MQVFIRGTVMAKISAKGIKRLKHCNSKGLCTVCLKPFNDGERRKRGAHVSCYQRMSRKIRLGETTDKDAIQDGILREHESAGRKSIDVAELPESVK
jgi:hypothetical protein